jgi:hypothetical protein
MASRSLSPEALLRPLPPALFAPAAAVVLFAGAVYCLGYEGLSGGVGLWPPSLLWSAYAVLPWLILFEAVKRRERRSGAPLPLATLGLLLAGTAAASIGVEYGLDRIGGASSGPLALQLLRRIPAIGATLLLLLLARRARDGAGEARSVEAEREALLRHAPALAWIRAADNYLELHLDGRIVTLRLTMREAADRLAPRGFVRIHRSYIVARARIASVQRNAVRLEDGTELPLGRAFAAALG